MSKSKSTIGVSEHSAKKHERIEGLSHMIATQHRQGKRASEPKCSEIVFVDVMCGSGIYHTTFRDKLRHEMVGSPLRQIRGFKKSITKISKGEAIGINQQFPVSFRFSDKDQQNINLLKGCCHTELKDIPEVALDIQQQDATKVLTELRKEVVANPHKVYVVTVDPNNLKEYPDAAVWKLIKASHKSENLFLILNIPTNIDRGYDFYNSDYFKEKGFKRRVKSIKKLQRLGLDKTFENVMYIMFRNETNIYGSVDAYGDYRFMTMCYWGGKVQLPRNAWEAHKMYRLTEMFKEVERKLA